MSQAGEIDVIGNNPEIPILFVTDDGDAVPILNTLEILGTYVPAGSIPVETTGSGNTVTVQVQVSQAIVATDVSKIGLSAFDSSAFSVDANGFVTLTGGGSSMTKLGVDASTAPGTNPVVPNMGVITMTGAQVASGVVGANVIRTNSLAANTVTIQIQRSTAVVASDSTKNGVSHFNSAEFTVDANGFVSLAGSGLAIDSIAVQTGTSPVVPTAGGLVTINGAVVAAGTNPLRSNGTGANTLALEVQISQALPATDATKIGLCNFDSAKMTCDANGFVSVPTATTSVIGVVTLATQVQSEYNTYGTTQVLQSGNIPFMFAKPAPIGSTTPNTGAFTSLSSNAGQTFSVGTNTYPSSSTTITSTAYSSINQIAQFNINGVVPASISSGFGGALQIQAQNTAGTLISVAQFIGIWDVPTSGSEVSYANIHVRSGGSSMLAFSAYADHVLMPKGQYVNVTTPGAYPYTTLISDYLIKVDTSSARTITPLANPATGATYVIKDTVGSAAANNITITPSGKNIDGAASFVMNINYGSVTITYTGTEWSVT